MKNNDIKVVCIADKNIDYSVFGFHFDNKEWVYWYNNTKRMYFSTKDYRVYFNQMTTQVLKVFFEMAQANVIKFIEYKNEHRMCLSDEEYKVIQEMRNRNKNEK